MNSMIVDAIKFMQQQNTAAIESVNDGLTRSIGVAVKPDGFTLVETEKYLDHRIRFRGTFTTPLINEFVTYCKEVDLKSNPHCFINPKEMTAKAFFNYGNSSEPGHCDNTATLELEETASFKALMSMQERQSSQRTLSDWIEEYADYITAVNSSGESVKVKDAVQAIRKTTIEEMTKSESEVADFSESKSLSARIEARADNNRPAKITFTCTPYHGLNERAFTIRLGIVTGKSEPMFISRIIKMELQKEEMSNEMRNLLTAEFNDNEMQVLIGGFSLK